MGDSRAEGSSTIGDEGPAAVSLTPDGDGTHVRIFESLQLEDSCMGDLPYYNFICQLYLSKAEKKKNKSLIKGVLNLAGSDTTERLNSTELKLCRNEPALAPLLQ